MAKVWIIMVLLFANVFADNEDISRNCDACIRSGNSWCNQLTSQGHCFSSTRDDACPNNDLDPLLVHKSISRDGDLFQPMYKEKNLDLTDLQHRLVSVTYASAKKKNITFDFLNTINDDPKILVEEGETTCNDGKCELTILAKALKGFCTYYEFVDVAVKVEGFAEHATVRFYVPCACECTKNATNRSSEECNYHGKYTCGICTCDSEWTGDKCEQSCTRGDIGQQECLVIDSLAECYGNGLCSCGNCKCFDSSVGSQYFDPSEKCAGICTQTIECSTCLRNGALGECRGVNNCDRLMTLVTLNETVATTEIDEQSRNVWVHCNEHTDECNFDYYTMMTDGQYYVMMKSNCNDAGAVAIAAGPGGAGGAGGATSGKVPLILGIVALVAAIAAVGGFLMWKHMNALPALPTSDPGYAHMDAEDCTGENPLYIPPTSSFKNPTYGKL